MKKDQIISNLRRIISLEESDINLHAELIENICLSTISEIKNSFTPIEVDIYRFLDDFDLRRNDCSYREYQTKKIIELLEGLR